MITPEQIAKLVAASIDQNHPELDSRGVNARTTTFLIEALGFVIINSTIPGPSRVEAVRIVSEGIRDIIK